MSKSMFRGAGNYNLKGKKILFLNCKCCKCINLKEKFLSKAIKKEMFEDTDVTDEVITSIDYYYNKGKY